MAAVADQVVVEVLADTDATKRKVKEYADSFERNMKRTQDASDRAEKAIVPSMKQKQFAIRNLGFQVGDFTQQVATGTPIFLAFGQQAGQAAGALVDMGGKIATVGKFLSGPWGAILLAATVLLGRMATASDEAGTAHRKQGDAARNLQEAIEDLDKATVRANQSSEQSTRQAIAAARGFLIEANGRREAAKAAIQQALANQRVAAGLPGAEGIDIATNIVVTGLQRELNKVEKDIAEGTKKLASVGIQNVIEATQASLTASGRAARQYERDVSALNEQLEAGLIDAGAYSAGVRDAFAKSEAVRNADRDATRAGTAARREANAERKAERDAAREAEAAVRAYYATVKAGNSALDDAAAAGQRYLDAQLKQDATLRDRLGPDAKDRADEVIAANERKFDDRMQTVGAAIDAADSAALDLRRDLSRGIAEAVIGAGNLGDALEQAFVRAGIAAIQSRVFDFLSNGSAGGLFQSLGNFVTNRPPARASGGHVSAGKLYGVNERGIEGFQPAGSGKIIPLGQMNAARPQGGVTVVQPLHFDMRGALTTPDLIADINGKIAQSSQAAVVGGATLAASKAAKARRRLLG